MAEWEIVNELHGQIRNTYEAVRRLAIPGGWLYQYGYRDPVAHIVAWSPPVFVPKPTPDAEMEEHLRDTLHDLDTVVTKLRDLASGEITMTAARGAELYAEYRKSIDEICEKHGIAL